MIQLKVRTEYSFGKTFAPIKNVIARLNELGCTHAAIVDGDTWGHIPFYKACKAAGIEPILGVEIAVSDNGSMPQKMWFLARNKSGLAELYRMTSKSYLQRISMRGGSVPRLYRSDVREMSADIIKFAGDIVDGEFLEDVNAIIDLSPASIILNSKKKKLAEQYDLSLVEVSDNAFCWPDDKKTFELIVNRYGGLKPSKQYILDELKYQDNAFCIAQACEGLEIPKAPTIHIEGDLEQLCREGIIYRKMDSWWNQQYEDRLN